MTARVLVVDDIAANLKLLEARLNAEYYEVALANSGPDALRAANAWAPDVILLDVMMPGMDGPTTLARLRGLEATAATPAVFMTAKVQPHEVSHYRELGSLDVISKPFDPMTLSATVRGIWERRDG